MSYPKRKNAPLKGLFVLLSPLSFLMSLLCTGFIVSHHFYGLFPCDGTNQVQTHISESFHAESDEETFQSDFEGETIKLSPDSSAVYFDLHNIRPENWKDAITHYQNKLDKGKNFLVIEERRLKALTEELEAIELQIELKQASIEYQNVELNKIKGALELIKGNESPYEPAYKTKLTSLYKDKKNT